MGATSADSPADIGNEDTVKAGVVLYLVVFIFLTLLTTGAAIACCMSGQPGERRLLQAVAASLPFLLVRLIHSLLLVFSETFLVSAAESSTSSVLTELFMAKIEEMVVVLIFLLAGLHQHAVPERDDGSQSTKQKLMYRASRGDFGGGKLGIASLVIAVAGALFSSKNDEQVGNQRDTESGLKQ